MQVNSNSYIFKSPYPSPVQTGQVDPSAQKESTQESSDTTQTSVASSSGQEAKSYQAEQKQSYNVANASGTNNLQSSIDAFSTVNSQVKAQQAYA